MTVCVCVYVHSEDAEVGSPILEQGSPNRARLPSCFVHCWGGGHLCLGVADQDFSMSHRRNLDVRQQPALYNTQQLQI